MTLLNPCETSTLTINAILGNSSGETACENQGPNESECLEVGYCYWDGFACLSSVDMVQDVTQPASTISWLDTDVIHSVTVVSCGAISYSISMQDSSSLDTSLF